MGIKNYFIYKKIKLAILGLKNLTTTSELSKIQKVAILVDESSAFNASQYKNLQKKMGLDDSHFNILTVKKKNSNYNEFKGVVLLTNEVNWKGKIYSTEIHHFTEPHYDLLIDFIPKNSALKQLIITKVNAKMKVGFVKNNPDLYNIIMNVDSQKIDVFISELIKYLHILKII